MRERIRKWAVPGGAVLLLVGALIYAFWPKPVPADFGVAVRGPMLVTIDDEGETRVKEAYVVSAPLSGRVRRFEGDVGDPVVAGETVVATVQPTDPSFRDIRTQSELEAAVKAAEAARDLALAEVNRLQAEHEFAQAEFGRTKTLADKGTVSQSALDRARMELRTRFAALDTSRAALKVREFELETAETRLLDPASALVASDQASCCFTVTAPVTGTILRVYQESEAVVTAGAPLIEVGDPRDLEIVVDLLSTEAVKIEPGDEVLIEDWGGPDTLAGRVRRVEPFGFTKVSALGIEEQRVNIIIDITDAPERWARLGHGYRVEARVVEWQSDDVLHVPISTLFRVGDEWALFKVDDNRARLARVEVGRMNQRTAEILSGLDEGETLILHPSDQIEDGLRVSARDAG